MSFAHLRPGEARKPGIDILPDGRRRLTRVRDLGVGGQVTDSLVIAWGTLDKGVATGAVVGYAGLRLVDQFSQEAPDNKIAWVWVYEQIPESAEVQVGNNTRIKLEDGREAIEAEFLQFSTGTYVPGTVGTTTAPGDSSAYLKESVQTNDGTLRRIKRTYVYAGVIATDDQELNNGKLLKKTIVAVKTAPSTPSGFILVGSPIQNPLGLPTYSYTFYKGEGEISRRTTRGQNGTTTDGSLGTSRLDIDYLTAPAASEPTWASVSGYTKLTVSQDERDGHMLWSGIFGKGTGLVAQLIGTARDGLREVTNIALGTRSAPSGIVTRDDYRNDDGHIVYTVTSKQTASGGSDPTAATYSVERYVPFLYPGRAKAYDDTYEYFTLLDVYKSPPIQAQVRATVTISYQTSDELGSITDYWNPTEWAVLRASWTGFGYNPYNQIEALSGYRSVDDTPVDATCSAFAPIDLTIMGNPVYGGTTAQVQVTGGPEDPGGNTYTLHAELDDQPAFFSTSGTPYYRKTVISATIPAQAALPV